MRRRLLPASFLLLLIGLAGCAHQSAGGGGGYYAGTAFGDCEFEGDCYGPGTNQAYTCVFFQAPAMPARQAITGTGRHHPFPRNVENRSWTPGSPPVDSTGGGSSFSAAPAPIMREPVVVASPSGDRAPAPAAPRTPN
jgi:hypothetical protein